MKRKASAEWQGDLKTGKGLVSTESGVLRSASYSFTTRFEGEKGTNPEELIAAAHAGCYSMALSGELGKAGHDVESIETEATVHIDEVDDGFAIKRIELRTRVTASGLDDSDFQQAAEAAKEGCPVSQALAAVETIDLDAQLTG